MVEKTSHLFRKKYDSRFMLGGAGSVTMKSTVLQCTVLGSFLPTLLMKKEAQRPLRQRWGRTLLLTPTLHQRLHLPDAFGLYTPPPQACWSH